MEQTTNEAAVERRGGKRLAADSRKKGGKKPLAIVGIVLAVVIAAYLGLCAYAGSLDTFYPNYRINGIGVGGMTVAEAQSALENGLFSQEITLIADDKAETPMATLSLADLGYQPEDFSGDAQFWMDDLKREPFPGRGWRYLNFLLDRYPGGSNWPDPNEEPLRATVQRVSGELSNEAQDSTFEVLDDSIQITKARDGMAVDEAELYNALCAVSEYSKANYYVPVSFITVPARELTAQEIYDEVAAEMKNAGYDAATDTILPERVGAEFDVNAAQAALDKAQPGETVEIDAVIERPAVTAEMLRGVLFRDVLGEARTHVGGTVARKNNVKLSASTINNLVLNTGDVFSYNESVGKRTAARGYQAAPAYVKGETVDEIGGGICQTSSTLYLACLRSNLEITERYAHRYVPAYIAAGMDATVSWGGPDYKFTNNTDYPVKIVTTYEGGYLTVKLLGTNVTGVTAKMTNEQLSSTPSQVVYEDDPTLAPGTEKVKTTPYTGSKWRTYRHLYDANGKLISSAYEATSDYKVRNKVILKGPAAAPGVPSGGGADIPANPGTTPEEPVTPPVEPLPPIIPEEENPPVVVLPTEPME